MATAAANANRGTVVQMGGRAIRFLPLNWATLELLQDKLDLVASMDTKQRTGFFTPEERNAILDVVHTAIAAANPDVDEAWTKQNLDLGNLEEVLKGVFTTNGFITTTAGDAAGDASGEAKAD